MPAPLPVVEPSKMALMIKPVGALCNLDCTYCYYLPTKEVYDGHEHRMNLSTLESIFAGFLPHAGDEVTISWQGGEPTLAGLAFFEKALEFQQKHKRAGQTVNNALQTNGTLLDDAWCMFLRKHAFLIGLSMDGDAGFHDHYRKSNAGKGTHQVVYRALQLMDAHDVQYNLLCVINDRNVKHPLKVWQYLLNLGARWLQFIPCIEWEVDASGQSENRLANYAPPPDAFGEFLCTIFDRWFERHRQRVSVRLFDSVISKLVTNQMPFCILSGACSGQLTIEHNGDVFGCDHFIERRWQLAKVNQPEWRNTHGIDHHPNIGLTIHGNGYRSNDHHGGRDITSIQDIETRYATPAEDSLDSHWFSRSDTQRLGQFAARKQSLPQGCLDCEYRQYCHGGCPKHRPHGGDIPEPTILCRAYKTFYGHTLERMNWLADFIRRGQQPPPCRVNVQAGARSDSQVGRVTSKVYAGTTPGRNSPCPCGSGLKFKKCCGR